MPLGIGQFQGHVVFAGNRFHHTDRHQRQRPRQILGQAHNLRALHAGGGLNLVARDDRAGHRRHHLHTHTKILELFLDQAAGHLQRIGRNGLLSAHWRAIEQIHLGQLAVGQLDEQAFLPLLGHARALRHINKTVGEHRLNARRLRFRENHGRGMQLLALSALHAHISFALAGGLTAERQILSQLTLFPAFVDPAQNQSAQTLRPGQP